MVSASVGAESSVSPQAYEILKSKANTIRSNEATDGWAYIVSGGVALGLSIPGYYLSKDVFARSVYSVGETLGVASIGYGSYLVLIEDDHSRFLKILERVPQLSVEEKNRLSHLFLWENSERARKVRKIRVISHSLTAGLNFLSAATSKNRDLKTALYFIGGINVLAALNFGFRASEEEMVFKKASMEPELLLGPKFVGLGFHF